jgi:hypothetical protein
MAKTEAEAAKSASEAEKRKATPSAGVFGFAGPTLFQPGQSKFAGGSQASVFKPESPDDTGGHSTAD